MDWLFFLWWALASRREPYTRDEWLRTHGLTHVADEEARQRAVMRRGLYGVLLLIVVLLVVFTVGMEYVATKHVVPAPVSQPVALSARDAQDRSCAAWTVAVMRQKADNQARAPEASIADMNSMLTAYSATLQAQQKACTTR
jgi:hypothetical protein